MNNPSDVRGILQAQYLETEKEHLNKKDKKKLNEKKNQIENSDITNAVS